jgi:hypothetical protein
MGGIRFILNNETPHLPYASLLAKICAKKFGDCTNTAHKNSVEVKKMLTVLTASQG